MTTRPLASFLLILAGWAGFTSAALAAQKPGDTPVMPDLGQVQEIVRLAGEATRLGEEGRYADAILPARRALEMGERMLGAEHETTLTLVNNLAQIYTRQARFADAEPLHLRALEARLRTLGTEHRHTLVSLNNLASLYQEQGRAAEAEPLLVQALLASERVVGRDDPATLTTANNLASLYHDQGRFAEAEALYLRVLEVRERQLGRDNAASINSVNNLAVLYRDQGRLAEAETFQRRALQASERVLGTDHPDTLRALSNLAALHQDQGRLAESRPLYVRALAQRERRLGRDHPETLASVINLASLHHALGQRTEAESLYRRALEASERTLGREHPRTLFAVNNLAVLYREQNRHAFALPLHRRALESSARVLGDDHPDTLIRAFNLLVSGLETGAGFDGLPAARLLVAGLRARRGTGQAARFAEAQQQREARSSASQYALAADAMWGNTDARSRDSRIAEAFTILQDATAGDGSEAITRMAVRRQAQAAGLDELVRRRESLSREWVALVSQISSRAEDSASATGEGGAALAARRDRIDREIEAIDQQLRRQFPDYFSLIRPDPLSVFATQALLRDDEALLLTIPSRFGTHVVIVRRSQIGWHRSPWATSEIGARVQRLRVEAGARAQQQINAQRPVSFDRGAAYELYTQLIEPVAARLAGARRLYVVAGGSLAGMPFSLLVIEAPQGADDDPEALRATAWLADRYALSHLPTVQSLALLRAAAGRTAPADSFAGFGDPLLSGAGTQRGIRTANALPSAEQVLQGARTENGLADVAALRRLARLPGTAVELAAMERLFGRSNSRLFLAERATERAARTTDLTQTGVIAFATHGLVPNDPIEFRLAEPGLVLTPPAQASAEDDGFLAASEVTTLRLDADWVILSACNSATGDSATAGVSQLARAFFYAGARNLLASHWPVADDVAARLTVRTLALERGADGARALTRAEALQQAMRELRMDRSQDDTNASNAHPFFWAPFVLIGDGGR
ncbi:MAG: tetratricopeptide repeat protein [Sphingosinicella sp.]